jgi:CRISPR-associated protein Csm3
MGKTLGKPIGNRTLDTLTGNDLLEAKKIVKIFGSSGAENAENNNIGPTRVSFRDCCLSEESRSRVLEENLSLTEVKSETAIDRIQGTARGGSLRQTERVSAGLSFDFSITLKELDIDSDDDLVDFLLQGLKLLEYDALGGSGSRGYGRVEFELADPELKERFSQTLPISN